MIDQRFPNRPAKLHGLDVLADGLWACWHGVRGVSQPFGDHLEINPMLDRVGHEEKSENMVIDLWQSQTADKFPSTVFEER
jgi:hypothetical protein